MRTLLRLVGARGLTQVGAIGLMRVVMLHRGYIAWRTRASGDERPEGHDQREPSLVLDAIAENGGEGVVLMLGAGAMGAAGVASLVDPEAFIHISWLEGDVTRTTSVRTGFFTPFVERRLRDAGIR